MNRQEACLAPLSAPVHVHFPLKCFTLGALLGNSPELHPRFRFAAPGVTHGAASTRLGGGCGPFRARDEFRH
ncbi:MAG: hypothetical protein BWX73_01608 [Lentisphaerae bacterium ADurb.Bin082]|nr:MAG: hypothetical protein BWX73_01608 [Lentisphaerae bacterium ADurb.Bin082]